jgi:hypothetical protein
MSGLVGRLMKGRWSRIQRPFTFVADFFSERRQIPDVDRFRLIERCAFASRERQPIDQHGCFPA